VGLSAAPRNYLIAGDTTNGPALGTYFYHRNHINSNSVITDSSGNEVTRLVYLPFGELSRPNSSGTDTVTSKFTGQEYDEEMGLYYYGARYYDPKVGRFLSPDPLIGDIGDPQSFNRYSYVENNPIKYIDPTGYQGCPADMCTSFPVPGDPGPYYPDPGHDPARPGAHDPVYNSGGGSGGGSSGASPPPPQPPTPTPYIASDAQSVQGMSAPPADTLPDGGNVAGGSSGLLGGLLSRSVAQAVLSSAFKQTTAPLAPPGVLVDENTVLARVQKGRLVFDERILYWFYQQVRNRGPWDYKQLGKQYEDFGNFNYGVTGSALGIPDWLLLRAAGYASTKADRSRAKKWGHWWGGPPYGDDPRDQQKIREGIQYWKENKERILSVDYSGEFCW
jgi:RHS repeat-associated protein